MKSEPVVTYNHMEDDEQGATFRSITGWKSGDPDQSIYDPDCRCDSGISHRFFHLYGDFLICTTRTKNLKPGIAGLFFG